MKHKPDPSQGSLLIDLPGVYGACDVAVQASTKPPKPPLSERKAVERVNVDRVAAIHKTIVTEMLGKPDGELVEVFEGAASNADHGLPDIPWHRMRKDGIYYRINMKYLFGCGPVEFSRKVGCTPTMAYFVQSGHKRFSKVLRNYVAALYNISSTTLKLISDHAHHERQLAENRLDEPCIIPDYLMHYFEPYVYSPCIKNHSMKWKEGRKLVKVNNISWMMEKAKSVPFENRLAFIQALESSYLYRQHVKSGGKIPDTETDDTTT